MRRIQHIRTLVGVGLLAICWGCTVEVSGVPDRANRADVRPDAERDMSDVGVSDRDSNVDVRDRDAGTRRGWRSLGGIGDPLLALTQLHGVTYARYGTEEDFEVVRSTDGGVTWSPLRETGFDNVVSKAWTPKRIEVTETPSGTFALVHNELYRNTSDRSWSDPPVSLPGIPVALTSVENRLVYLYRVEGERTRRLAFSSDRAERWTTARTFDVEPIIRAWDGELYVAEKESAPHGAPTWGPTDAVHIWSESNDSWTTRDRAPSVGLERWRKIDGRFYALDTTDEWMGESADGFDWSRRSLEETEPRIAHAFPVSQVIGAGEADGVFAAVGTYSEVGHVDERGAWTTVTPDGPLAEDDFEILPTAPGMLLSVGGVTYRWSSQNHRWSVVDITSAHTPPDTLAATRSGRVLARYGDELFMGGREGWKWWDHGLDWVTEEVISLRGGDILKYSGNLALHRANGEGDRFEPLRKSDHDEAAAYPWLESMGGYVSPDAVFTSVVQDGDDIVLGFDAYRPWDERTSKCRERDMCGGGLYRVSLESGAVTAVEAELLRPDGLPRPRITHLALRDDRLWAAGDHGLAVTSNDGASWSLESNRIVDSAGRLRDDVYLREMIATRGRLYGLFETPDYPADNHERYVAVRTADDWKMLDAQPPGFIHDVDTAGARLYSATDRGVYVLHDGADAWQSPGGELPERSALHVELTPSALAVAFSDGEIWRRMRHRTSNSE